MTSVNLDNCTSFHLEEGAVLGRLVRLDNVINEILTRHQYPMQVNSVIAEFTSLAVLLSSSMKYDGLFTLQTQTDGPVSVVVVDVTSQGNIRSYAKFDEERIMRAQELRKTSGEIEAAPYVIGGGHLAFTIDQGNSNDVYQGIVEIKGKNLSEIALRYFKQSEQIETFIKLYLKAPQAESDKWEAAGIMLQKTPQTGGSINKDIDINELWNDAQVFASSLKDSEVFDHSLSSDEILNRLFHANHLNINGVKDYVFSCRCSRDKLLNTLSGFNQQDIDDMSSKGSIEVDCSFCSEKYTFDRAELNKH